MKRGRNNTVTVRVLVEVPIPEEYRDGGLEDDYPVHLIEFSRDQMTPKAFQSLPPGKREAFLAYEAAFEALEDGDEERLRHVCAGLRRSDPLAWLGAAFVTERVHAMQTVEERLSEEFRKIRFRLWRDKTGGFVPALVCSNLTEAWMLSSILNGLGIGNSVRACPRCGALFLQKRSDARYCSATCRDTFRVAKYRAKKKAAKR